MKGIAGTGQAALRIFDYQSVEEAEGGLKRGGKGPERGRKRPKRVRKGAKTLTY
jgi:hypothetical protein